MVQGEATTEELLRWCYRAALVAIGTNAKTVAARFGAPPTGPLLEPGACARFADRLG
jgi:hypothetical protein